MKQARSRTFVCEECNKSVFVKSIGEYQFKYQQRIGTNIKKMHYFCSNKCKDEWIEKNVIVSNANVLCPYFRRSENRFIRCDSFVPNANNIVLNFQTSEDRKQYKKNFCCKNYQQCKIAKEIKREA